MTRIDLRAETVAWLLAFEKYAQACGFWVVCPDCAQNFHTHKHLVTDNAPEAVEWKADCGCTERRFLRETLPILPSDGSDLLWLKDRMLKGARLDLRCVVKATGCLTTPLTVSHGETETTVRCGCYQIDLTAGVYRFRKQERPAA